MVATPWGDSAALREGKLPPGPAAESAEVAANQRRRLFGAMVAIVAEKGYEGTGVADLSEMSGVSPRSFYELFPGKDACFLATLEAVVSTAVETTLAAPASGEWRDAVRQPIVAFASLAAAQPAAARVCLVEAYTAGPEAAGLVDRAIRQAERRLEQRLAEVASRPIPPELAVAAVAATVAGVRGRLMREQAWSLPEFAEQLTAFLLEFEPPARPLRTAIRPAERQDEEDLAGDHAERAMRAFEALLTEQRVAEITMGQVAKRAGMSVRTLYANFTGRDELLLAAVDSASSQAVAAMLPAYRRGSSPPEGVRFAFSALFGLLASRPNLAHVLLVGAREGGQATLERRAEALEAIDPVLSMGIPAHKRPPFSRVAAEALPDAVLGLAARRMQEAGAAALPGLVAISTYIVLAPHLGAEQATAAAEGKGYRRLRPDPGRSPLNIPDGRPESYKILLALNGVPRTLEEIAAESSLDHGEAEAQILALQKRGVVEGLTPEDGGPTLFQQKWGRIETVDWEKRGQSEREAISAEILEAIEAEIEEAVEARTFDARADRFLVRVPVWLDERGWRELYDVFHDSLTRSNEIQRQSHRRLREAGDGGAGSFGRLLFVTYEVPRQN